MISIASGTKEPHVPILEDEEREHANEQTLRNRRRADRGRRHGPDRVRRRVLHLERLRRCRCLRRPQGDRHGRRRLRDHRLRADHHLGARHGSELAGPRGPVPLQHGRLLRQPRAGRRRPREGLRHRVRGEPARGREVLRRHPRDRRRRRQLLRARHLRKVHLPPVLHLRRLREREGRHDGHHHPQAPLRQPQGAFRQRPRCPLLHGRGLPEGQAGRLGPLQVRDDHGHRDHRRPQRELHR